MDWEVKLNGFRRCARSLPIRSLEIPGDSGVGRARATLRSRRSNGGAASIPAWTCHPAVVR